MPITVTRSSKKYLEKLINKQFNKIELKEDKFNKAGGLIIVAKEWGLIELANKLENKFKK